MQAVPATPPLGPVPPPALVLHESAVRKGMLSFPCGSALGPSGMRLSHLREYLRQNSGWPATFLSNPAGEPAGCWSGTRVHHSSPVWCHSSPLQEEVWWPSAISSISTSTSTLLSVQSSRCGWLHQCMHCVDLAVCNLQDVAGCSSAAVAAAH